MSHLRELKNGFFIDTENNNIIKLSGGYYLPYCPSTDETAKEYNTKEYRQDLRDFFIKWFINSRITHVLDRQLEDSKDR